MRVDVLEEGKGNTGEAWKLWEVDAALGPLAKALVTYYCNFNSVSPLLVISSTKGVQGFHRISSSPFLLQFRLWHSLHLYDTDPSSAPQRDHFSCLGQYRIDRERSGG